MYQAHFLSTVECLNEEDEKTIADFDWIEKAIDRRAIAETPDVKSSASIFHKCVVIPGMVWEVANMWNPLRALWNCGIIVKQFYPEEVTTPVFPNYIYNAGIQLAIWIPEHIPRVPKPTYGIPPRKGDHLIMVSGLTVSGLTVSGLAGINLLKVVWSDKEPYQNFINRFPTPIDVSTGVAGSFIYRRDGCLVGIAVTSTTDNEVLAIPIVEVKCLYDSFRPTLARLGLFQTKSR